MSIFSKGFEIQKENANECEISGICQGINRVRFIKNRINDKGNFVLKLLSTQRQLPKSKTNANEENPNFVTSMAVNSTRRPFSESRSLKVARPRLQNQPNEQKILRAREQKKQLQLEIKDRKTSELMDKVFRKRKMQKEKQLNKLKTKIFFAEKTKNVITFKKELAEQSKMKLQANQKYLEDYENRLLLGQKLREFVLEKLGFPCFGG